MNTKLFSKLAIGAIAAAGLLSTAGIASAIIVERNTETQTGTAGPQQTDFTGLTIELDSFDEIPIIENLPPGETFVDFNSVHLAVDGTALAGPGGNVTCFVGDANGRCTGTVDSTITLDISVAGINLAQVIPLTTFAYDLAEGQSVDIPEDMDVDSDVIVYDLMDMLPTGASDADIQAVLDQFDASIVGPTVTLTVDGDGTVTTTNNTGVAAGQNPLRGQVDVELFYDYIVPGCVCVPEPGSLLGLGLIGGLGLLAKRKKS